MGGGAVLVLLRVRGHSTGEESATSDNGTTKGRGGRSSQHAHRCAFQSPRQICHRQDGYPVKRYETDISHFVLVITSRSRRTRGAERTRNMLLEMDRPGLQPTSGPVLTTGERSTTACGPPRRDDPTLGNPGAWVSSAFRQPVKWMVGVPFNASNSRVIWMYYIVDEARDSLHAVRAALERANSIQERQVRGGASVMAEHVEVQKILQDAIGRLSLVDE